MPRLHGLAKDYFLFAYLERVVGPGNGVEFGRALPCNGACWAPIILFRLDHGGLLQRTSDKTQVNTHRLHTKPGMGFYLVVWPRRCRALTLPLPLSPAPIRIPQCGTWGAE